MCLYKYGTIERVALRPHSANQETNMIMDYQ